MKKSSKPFLYLLLAGILGISAGCGCGTSASDAAEEKASLQDELSSAADAGALDRGTTVTTFLAEPFYDGTIQNADDALTAVESILEKIGGDENTELVYHDEISNAEDTVFYCFEQALGGIQVEGGNVKVIVDKDGKALGLNSTLVSGLEPDPMFQWEITAEEAEAAVTKDYLDPGARVLSGQTESTIITNPVFGNKQYVWVVYSTNTSPENGKAYLAHYITGTGDYLYALPVAEPGDAEALSGSVSVFAFDGYDIGEWSGTVTDIDGPKREITVPVLIDQASGLTVLADPERKILCADYTDFVKNDTLTPITSSNDDWNNNELITYEMFIRVWDFYDQIGWHGPDGEGTPMLLLLNLVDNEGNPVDQASYSGLVHGFQCFVVNDEFGDGSCSDIIGHEFTHCITNRSLIHSFYANDAGAINESVSDIMGNLIEMYFGDSPGGEWLFSERHKNGTVRNMKDPHEFCQPEYIWDSYFVPDVTVPLDLNDRGGVHINSSLLNQISYKLDQAGMPFEDQIYFWMNVDLSLTPTTDFPLLAKILPWCLEVTGYSEYADALNSAIADADLERKEVPEKGKNDQAIVNITLPFHPDEDLVDVCLSGMNLSSRKSFDTWPAADTDKITAVLPEGDYLFTLYLVPRNIDGGIFCQLTPQGWTVTEKSLGTLVDESSPEELQSLAQHFDAGTTSDLKTDGLSAAMQTLKLLQL